MDPSSSSSASTPDLLAMLAGQVSDDMFDSVMRTGLRSGRAAAMRAFAYITNLLDMEGINRIVLLARQLQNPELGPSKGHARHACLVAMACMVHLNNETGFRTETPKMATLRTNFPKEFCNEFLAAVIAEANTDVIWKKDTIDARIMVPELIAGDQDVMDWIKIKWPSDNRSALESVFQSSRKRSRSEEAVIHG
jgi:hypothetical protein